MFNIRSLWMYNIRIIRMYNIRSIWMHSIRPIRMYNIRFIQAAGKDWTFRS